MPESSLPLLTQSAGHILVVDDEERNRVLLSDLLKVNGHTVSEAADGEEALRRAAENRPDVVLLDVMMPKLDGFEVCRRLKRDPKTAPIPVLLVTVLTARDDRLRGIEAGANDFLSKPIDTQEVLLRVRNHVNAKHLYDQVQKDYERLRELEALRDNLTHMVVHDMRSPLTGAMGFLQLLRMRFGNSLPPEASRYTEQALTSIETLVDMVSSLLDVSRLESGQMPLNRKPCDVKELAGEAAASLGALIQMKGISLDMPVVPVTCVCDPDIIRRVLRNLLDNAVKFAPRGSKIRVTAERDANGIRVTVTDQGPGIPPEYHGKIFEKFGQVEAYRQDRKYSTGLGLTFCKLAVEAHGGRIGIDSEVGKGSALWFLLPSSEKPMT